MNNIEKRERFFLDNGIPEHIREEAKITVPCEVRAFAEVKEVEIKRKGGPVITCNAGDPPGEVGAVSKFTVSQRVVIKIPIDFRAEADVGEGYVEFSLCPGHAPHCPYEEETYIEEEPKEVTRRRV